MISKHYHPTQASWIPSSNPPPAQSAEAASARESLPPLIEWVWARRLRRTIRRRLKLGLSLATPAALRRGSAAGERKLVINGKIITLKYTKGETS